MEKPSSSTTTPLPQNKPQDLEEPKTLTTKQLQAAREAALEVLKKNFKEEETKIFTEGPEKKEHLESEEGSVKIHSNEGSDYDYEDDYDISEDSNTTDDEIPFPNALTGIRDVVSAPF